MKLQIYLELSEQSLTLCGIQFRIAWNTKEARSIHPLASDKPHRSYFEVKRIIKDYRTPPTTLAQRKEL